MMAWTWPAPHNQTSTGLGCNTTRWDGCGYSDTIDTDRTEKEYNNVSKFQPKNAIADMSSMPRVPRCCLGNSAIADTTACRHLHLGLPTWAHSVLQTAMSRSSFEG